MTTNSLSRKQIIILINTYNSRIIGNFANTHIANINGHLKKAKLVTIAKFIQVKNKDIIIKTNKTSFVSDMSIIKKYLKENNNINSNHIDSSCLSKSKSYLKISGLPYILEKTNLLIISNLIKEVIKETHIFNDVILASKPYIIKASSKYDMAIVWINI